MSICEAFIYTCLWVGETRASGPSSLEGTSLYYAFCHSGLFGERYPVGVKAEEKDKLIRAEGYRQEEVRGRKHNEGIKFVRWKGLTL